MKKLIYITLLLFITLATTSCLDDQEPSLSLAIDGAFNSTDNLEATLVGAYASFQSRGLGGANLTILGDLMGDNVSWQGDNISYSEIFNRTLGSNNLDAAALWTAGYNVINTANLILEKLPEISDAKIEANRDRIAGECYFLRAVSHFELVRFYSQQWNNTPGNTNLSIPILTKATLAFDEIEYPERSSLNDLYNQVIADLEMAASLLPETYKQGRANVYVAYGYLMRVALQQGDYEAVVNYSRNVLDGPYALNAESSDFFTNEYSPESIFEVAITTESTSGGNSAISAYYNPFVRGQIRISNDFAVATGSIVTLAQLERIAAANAVVFDTRVSNLVVFGAFSNKYELTTLDDNAPIMRLADIMLARAEALTEINGVNQQSIDLLNQVRLRSLRVVDLATGSLIDPANYVAFQLSDFASKEELINTILLERQVELAFEGSRFYDLLRRRLPVRGLNPGDDLLVLPIPQRERDVNPMLVQNDGY